MCFNGRVLFPSYFVFQGTFSLVTLFFKNLFSSYFVFQGTVLSQRQCHTSAVTGSASYCFLMHLLKRSALEIKSSSLSSQMIFLSSFFFFFLGGGGGGGQAQLDKQCRQL